MGFLSRRSGVHRAGLSVRSKIAAVLTVLGLTVGGGALALGVADASPWNPNVTVVGPVFACGPHSHPLGIHYQGNTGDRGFVPVRGNGYRIDLHRVPSWRGEFVWGSVDCTGKRPVGFGFGVQRPWRGNVVGHAI